MCGGCRLDPDTGGPLSNFESMLSCCLVLGGVQCHLDVRKTMFFDWKAVAWDNSPTPSGVRNWLRLFKVNPSAAEGYLTLMSEGEFLKILPIYTFCPDRQSKGVCNVQWHICTEGTGLTSHPTPEGAFEVFLTLKTPRTSLRIELVTIDT